MKRAFAPCDLAVYLLLFALVLGAAFAGRGEGGAEYIVSVGGERVCTVSGSGAEIAPAWASRVKVEKEKDAILLTVDAGEGGFNEIEWKDGKIRMRNANCSAHKDCTRMLPLSDKSSLPIVCAPHRLKIERTDIRNSPVAG